MSITLALDKQSARRIDANGYLHVEPNPISKATVNPYKGSEIPGCEQLGLDPNKVYYLLRDPKELKKSAPTFNNLPILSKHIPVSSFDMDKPEVKALYVGSTGTDAEFDGTYLNNTLVLHAKSAIDDIQAKKKHELSCAYRYQPDMTPGTFEGQHYDGVMRDIQGNHVALVTEGRAGHDVKVMDSKNGGAKVVDYRKVSTAMGKDSAEKVRAVLFGLDQKAMDGSITKEVQGSDYETAEAAAKSAGTLAGMQPTPENRKQAARLSREAARLHRSAGFAKQAKYWDGVAAEFEKPAGGAKDSNPEGINQYTASAQRSSVDAKEASKVAEKGAQSSILHTKAEAAHTKAAEAHSRAAKAEHKRGNHFRGVVHEGLAQEHRNTAHQHHLKAGRIARGKDSALDASSEGMGDSICLVKDIARRKDVSAKDSNPEGINQYTGYAQYHAREALAHSKDSSNSNARKESVRAALATEKALKENTPQAHIEAARAHSDAKVSHTVANTKAFARGNSDKAPSDHGKAERSHLLAATELSKDSALDAGSITKRKDVSAKSGERDYGDVQFADPKNNKYPLDTPEHVRAAASYFGMTKNRSQYGKEDQTKIDKRISAAERKFKLGKFAEGK